MRTSRTVLAFVVLGMISVAMICVGAAVLTGTAGERATTEELLTGGRQAAVSDARVRMAAGVSDDVQRAVELEVTFTEPDGRTVTASTRLTPTIPAGFSVPDGWNRDFPGKEEILGSAVRYLPGDPVVVDLEQELRSDAKVQWRFLDILGIGMVAMGALCATGIVLTAVRRRR